MFARDEMAEKDSRTIADTHMEDNNNNFSTEENLAFSLKRSPDISPDVWQRGI